MNNRKNIMNLKRAAKDLTLRAQFDIRPYTLDNVLKYLEEANERGENICLSFNSGNGEQKYYSTDLDVRDAYIRATGLTKEENDKFQEEFGEVIKARDENLSKELTAKYNKIKQAHIEEAKQNAVEVKDDKDLDKTISFLQEARDMGEDIYIDFNGTKLYSIDIDPERAYVDVTGHTKKEWDEMDKQHNQKDTISKDELEDFSSKAEPEKVAQAYQEITDRQIEKDEIEQIGE